MDLSYRPHNTDRRLGLLLTALVHLALVGGWQMVRTLPAPAVSDEAGSRILWIPLPPSRPRLREPAQAVSREAVAEKAAAPRHHARPAAATPTAPVVTAGQPAAPAAGSAAPIAATNATNADLPAAPAAPAAQHPSAAAILQQARRDIGRIDKGLRKENSPYIAAPLDSPMLRMRRKMEEAAALARPGLFEAPKVEELVNNTGDGARRTRVITGNGTYCVTERATNTDVEMIEHHGKRRLTNCPAHETPASKQDWRTLRD